nr:hypothetical protein [Alternaria alternata polymycovirus 2]
MNSVNTPRRLLVSVDLASLLGERLEYFVNHDLPEELSLDHPLGDVNIETTLGLQEVAQAIGDVRSVRVPVKCRDTVSGGSFPLPSGLRVLVSLSAYRRLCEAEASPCSCQFYIGVVGDDRCYTVFVERVGLSPDGRSPHFFSEDDYEDFANPALLALHSLAVRLGGALDE